MVWFEGRRGMEDIDEGGLLVLEGEDWLLSSDGSDDDGLNGGSKFSLLFAGGYEVLWAAVMRCYGRRRSPLLFYTPTISPPL